MFRKLLGTPCAEKPTSIIRVKIWVDQPSAGDVGRTKT